MYLVDEETYLMHYGVKGMKWGVRKTRSEARRDAKKYVRAKMFYGETAGTERKLLNAKLKPKMKDPTYKQFFDEYVQNADTAEAARHARGKRAAKDAAKTGKRYTKKALKVIGPIAAASAGAYYAKNKSQIDAAVAYYVDAAKNELHRRRTARQVGKMFK